LGGSTAAHEVNLRVSGKPDRVEKFREMVIAERNGRPIRLGEVAEVRDGIEEQRSLGMVDGVPAVSLDIIKQSGQISWRSPTWSRRLPKASSRNSPGDQDPCCP
jgi:multidrug efflux pump subunit AcrB